MTDFNSLGALRTDITLTLHTKYATNLWIGKQVEKDNKLIMRIASVPYCLSILSRINQHAAQDDPYADNYLIIVEDKINIARAAVAKLNDDIFDVYADKIPADIKLSNSFNVSPYQIPLIINSAIGYQLIYLLADFDSFVRVVMTAAHIAIISRNEARDQINNASHLVRSVFGLIQRYQDAGVSRADMTAGTANALAAIKRFGALPDDILSGKRRSQFAPINHQLINSGTSNNALE